MPVYEYQGKHYELSETDPVKAKEKIVASVGGKPSEKKSEEPGFLSQAGDVITGAAKALTTGVDLTKVLTKPETLTTKVSEKIGAPVIKDVSWDKSKMKLSPASEYIGRGGQRAAESTAAGVAFSPFTGGASIPAAAGAGFVQGVAEQAASDLGLSADLQTLAGMVGPVAAGSILMKTVPNTPQERNSILNAEATDKLKSTLAKKALTKVLGMPSASSGIIGAPLDYLKSRRPVDYKAVGAQLESEGAPVFPGQASVERSRFKAPEPMDVGQTKFQQEATAKLQDKFPGVQIDTAKGERVSNPLYEKAKSEYTATMPKENFVKSPEFASLTKDIPAEKTKFSKVFENDKGEPLTGEDVINNLQFNKLQLSNKDLKAAREVFNDFLQKNATGKVDRNSELGRFEQQARSAYETESAAIAKDTLPALFQNNDASGINKQLWNLSKSEEGMKIFNSELINHLKSVPSKEAKALWGKIGPNVKISMKIPDEKYSNITKIINGAKTPKEIDRATRILRGVVGPLSAEASQTKEEE